MTVLEGAFVHPSENCMLFKMAEDRNMTVGTMLNGYPTPLTACEFHLYETYQRVKTRIENQKAK